MCVTLHRSLKHLQVLVFGYNMKIIIAARMIMRCSLANNYYYVSIIE